MDMQHQYWVGGIYNLVWRRGDSLERLICLKSKFLNPLLSLGKPHIETPEKYRVPKGFDVA